MVGSQTLLADYVENGSDQAFRDLVGAYINFVFSTALRVVGGDRPLAEDVVQTVFTDLARKAPLLPVTVKLGGWLHRHTCFVGRKALRREHRRRIREQRALEMQLIQEDSAENLGHLTVILDEAIDSLAAADRAAIALRFFEQLDFRAVGKALGSSEDAARMRVARAVEKLGVVLRRRGVAWSFAGLGYILTTQTVSAAAPPALVAATCKAALAHGFHQMGLFALFKEACVTKLNVALVSSAALIAMATLFLPAPPPQIEAEIVEAETEFDPGEITTAPEMLADTSPQPSPVVAATTPAGSPAIEPVSKPEPEVAIQTRTAPALVQTKPAKPLPPALPVSPPAVPLAPSVAQNQPLPVPRTEPSLGTAGRWQRNWQMGQPYVLSYPAANTPPWNSPMQTAETGRSTAGQSPAYVPDTARGQWSPATRATPNPTPATTPDQRRKSNRSSPLLPR